MCSINLFGAPGQEEDSRWALNVVDAGFELLLVSQFTLCATWKGRKPIFNRSMAPEQARVLFDRFVELAREAVGEKRVSTGRFGTLMEVGLVNHGPVTIILDSQKKAAD